MYYLRKFGTKAVLCVGLALLWLVVAQGGVGYCGWKSFVPCSMTAKCVNCETGPNLRIEGSSVVTFQLRRLSASPGAISAGLD